MPAYRVTSPPTYTSLVDKRPARVRRPSAQYGRLVYTVNGFLDTDRDGDLRVVTDDGFVEFVHPACLTLEAGTPGLMRGLLWRDASALMAGDFDDTVAEYGRLVEHRKRYRTREQIGAPDGCI